MKILDSSAIINKKATLPPNKYITIPEVLDEIKDQLSKAILESMLENKSLSLREPKKESINELINFVEKDNMSELLSKTDIKILALAKESNLTLVTDDYDIQNCCKSLSIKFEPITTKGIQRVYKWKKKCVACGHETIKDLCEVCGSNTKTTK